jgi:hypothetical protein
MPANTKDDSPSCSHLHGPGLVAPRSLSFGWGQVAVELEVKACELARWRLLVGTCPPPCLRRAASQTSFFSPVLIRSQEACHPLDSGTENFCH